MGDKATVGAMPPVPNLAVGINAPAPKGDAGLEAITPAKIEGVLAQIYANLQSAVQDAWNTPEGKGNIADPDSLDEQWSRLITEMLLFVPYQGPNNYGYVRGKAEKVFYGKMIDAQDPAYPIVACCQQLTTMAGISRGFDGLAEHDIGATTAENVETVGGKVIPKKDAQLGPEIDSAKMPLSKVARAIENKVGPDPGVNWELTPGSCYVRTGFDHVAFLLRVDRDKRLVQFFDTGAMTDKVPQRSWPKSINDLQNWPGIYDYHWQPDVYQGLKHWGFLPRDDDKLAKGIARMKISRPLGFVRLVLRELDSKKLVFATPLLLMHEPQPERNYSIARFLGALRGLVGREKLEGMALIYIPQREAHGNEKNDDPHALMLRLKDPPVPAVAEGETPKAPREVTLREMVEDVRRARQSPTWNPSPVWHNKMPADFKCIVVLHTLEDLVQKEMTDSQKRKYPIWVKQANSFKEGLAGVRNWEISPPSSGTTVWKPSAPTDLASWHTLPWDKPTFGAKFGTAEDWAKMDWSKFEYFKGSWDGSQWNSI